MAVGRCLLVDGAAQVQFVDDGAGAQIEHLGHGALDILFRYMVRAEGLYHDRDRLRHADGVGDLHLAAVGQSCGHDVFGYPARRIGCRAVHLGAVLAGKRPAAVSAHAAVGVDDDLAAGETGVAHGAADDEAARGVHVDLAVVGERHPFGLEHRADDRLDNGLAQGVLLDVLGVLGGHDHLLNRRGRSVDVAHRYLGLAVGAQKFQRAVLAHLRESLGEAMGQIDRHGHERARLVAGIAEHHALVARAYGLVGVGCGRLVALGLEGLVHALGDVGGLLVNGAHDGAGVAVEAVLRAVVADGAHHVARDGLHVYVGLGANLAGDEDGAGGDERLAGAAHLRRVGRVAVGCNVALLG